MRAWLAWLNREVLRPVTLSVHVYAVRMEREADYGIGLAGLVKKLFGTSAELAVTPESVAVVRPSEAVGDTLSATVRALSRAGTVSRVLSADIPSLNGKPAQFFELYKEAYVKEHRTTAGEGIAQTEIVPGTVSSGFAASYVPRITGPGEVLVRLFASLRDRPVFREITGGGATIQLPAYASRAVQVTQRIRRGETLLVTGFTSRRAETDGSGTFHEEVPLPGGTRQGALARTEQVLLVKAEIGAPMGICAALAPTPTSGSRSGWASQGPTPTPAPSRSLPRSMPAIRCCSGCWAGRCRPTRNGSPSKVARAPTVPGAGTARCCCSPAPTCSRPARSRPSADPADGGPTAWPTPPWCW